MSTQVAHPHPAVTLQAVETLLGQACANTGKLRHQLADAEEREARLQEQVDRLRRELPGAPLQTNDKGVPEQAWMRAARELLSFSASELGSELGVSKIVARRHIKELEETGRLIPDGTIGKTPTWRFAKPTEAGVGFETQQRLRVVATPERAAMDSSGIAGTGNNPLLNALTKEVRAIVKGAIADGWAFSETGTHHFVLKKGPHRVSVSGTPRNPSQHAKRVAADLRKAARA